MPVRSEGARDDRSTFSTARPPGWYWLICCHARYDVSMMPTRIRPNCCIWGWNGSRLPRACSPFANKVTASAKVSCTRDAVVWRSEEHTSELQSLMRISYAVFCLKQNKKIYNI